MFSRGSGREVCVEQRKREPGDGAFARVFCDFSTIEAEWSWTPRGIEVKSPAGFESFRLESTFC
jgi:hypothetical protein